MASRAELIQMCDELKIEWDGLSIDEMKTEVKTVSDRLYKNRKIHHSADNISETLRKFLTMEYDYKIFDKEGEEKDYRFNTIGG